jgi:hypothetical protein
MAKVDGGVPRHTGNTRDPWREVDREVHLSAFLLRPFPLFSGAARHRPRALPDRLGAAPGRARRRARVTRLACLIDLLDTAELRKGTP